MSGLSIHYSYAQQPAKIDLRQQVPSLPVQQGLYWQPDLATRHLGFFCRQEIKMDKQTAVPLRMRLGSMQQTDWLEGKPNAQPPQR